MPNNTPTTPTNGHLNLGSIKHYDNNKTEGYELYDFDSLVKDNDFFKKFEIEQEDYIYDLEPQSNNLFFMANFEETSDGVNSLFNAQYRVQSIDLPNLTYEYETDQLTKVPLIKNGKSSYSVSITWLEDVYHSIYSYHEKWLDSWYDFRHNLLRVGQYGRFRKCSIVTYHYVKSGDIFNPTYKAQPIMLIQLNGLVPKGLPSLKLSYSEDQSDQLLTLEYLCSDYNIIYNKDFADTNAEVWNPQLAFNAGFSEKQSADHSEKARIIYATTGLAYSGESLKNSDEERRQKEIQAALESMNADASSQTKAANASSTTAALNSVETEKNDNNKDTTTTDEEEVKTKADIVNDTKKALDEAEAAALDINNNDENKKVKYDEAKKAYEHAVLEKLKEDKENLEKENDNIKKQIEAYKSLMPSNENDPKFKEYEDKIADLQKQEETNNLLIESKNKEIENQQNIIDPPQSVNKLENRPEAKPTKEIVDSLDEEKKNDLDKLTDDDIKTIVDSEIVNKQVSHDVAGNPTYSDFFVDEENTRYSIKDDEGNETFIVDVIQNHEGSEIGSAGAGLSVVVTNGTQYKVFGSDGALKEAGTVNNGHYNASEEHWANKEFIGYGNNPIGKQMADHSSI